MCANDTQDTRIGKGRSPSHDVPGLPEPMLSLRTEHTLFANLNVCATRFVEVLHVLARCTAALKAII
jgi:hypothetical protein